MHFTKQLAGIPDRDVFMNWRWCKDITVCLGPFEKIPEWFGNEKADPGSEKSWGSNYQQVFSLRLANIPGVFTQKQNEFASPPPFSFPQMPLYSERKLHIF